MQEEVLESGAMIESESPVVQTAEITDCTPVFPYIYDQCEGGVRITGWNEETPAEAVLPSEIDGLPLVEIGPEAFSGCTHLTSVGIPESVTMIGERAFLGCSSLTRINLPQGLKALEKGVFSDCIALNQISVPDSVVAIEESAFENCKELSAVTLSTGIITLGNRAFFACSQINDVTLPDTLEQIGEGAFQNCESLSGIDIPESVTQIGDAAFFNSLMLTATVPVSYKNELMRFMPESCEVTYSGIEKPNVYGEIGDIITFGSYEQDNDLTNGKEPIEWQILEKDGSRIYVISKYGLDSQRYHDKWEVVCWETCKLRVWLNQTFYAEAFNPAEQGMIVTTDVRSVHPSGSYPSKTVQDKVFLLDFDGSYRYFKGEKARTCIATAYAKAQGIPAPLNGSLELTRIVLKACAFNPDDRYHSVQELAEDLRNLPRNASIVVPDTDSTTVVEIKPKSHGKLTPSTHKKSKHTKPAFIAMVALVITAICLVVVTMLIKSNQTTSDRSAEVALSAEMTVSSTTTPSSVAPDSFTYTYAKNETGITIIGFEGELPAQLEIPSKIDGFPVNSIGGWTFQGCSNLSSVTIPNGVTSIGMHTFSECKNLTSILVYLLLVYLIVRDFPYVVFPVLDYPHLAPPHLAPPHLVSPQLDFPVVVAQEEMAEAQAFPGWCIPNRKAAPEHPEAYDVLHTPPFPAP